MKRLLLVFLIAASSASADTSHDEWARQVNAKFEVIDSELAILRFSVSNPDGCFHDEAIKQVRYRLIKNMAVLNPDADPSSFVGQILENAKRCPTD